jgi:hypothetical protein
MVEVHTPWFGDGWYVTVTSGDHERRLVVSLCHCLTPPESQRTKFGHKWGGGVSYLVIIKYMTQTPTLTDFIYRSSIYQFLFIMNR